MFMIKVDEMFVMYLFFYIYQTHTIEESVEYYVIDCHIFFPKYFTNFLEIKKNLKKIFNNTKPNEHQLFQSRKQKT
jgi:hypothetical protein